MERPTHFVLVSEVRSQVALAHGSASAIRMATAHADYGTTLGTQGRSSMRQPRPSAGAQIKVPAKASPATTPAERTSPSATAQFTSWPIRSSLAPEPPPVAAVRSGTTSVQAIPITIGTMFIIACRVETTVFPSPSLKRSFFSKLIV